MSDRRFPILGTEVPPMLGRDAIINKMISALTKAVPDHLQMVGPRFAGKTVILHELVARLRKEGSPYTAVVLWDLGHQTPEADELFMQRLARELCTGLTAKHANIACHLKDPQGNPFQDIAEILDLLKDESGKALVIMDGFDKPLSNGQLTRNLWDQLRELALKPSLRLVTASRRTLRDLIRHPDAQTSDFWNIFDPTPVRVGCFDDGDLAAVLGSLPDLSLAAGAKTELWNASNGFPVMTLEILNSLCEEKCSGSISDETVRTACDSAFPALRDKIDVLWTDCSPSCQDLFRRVLDEGTLSRTGIPPFDADVLIERGFAHQAANKLQRPNRLLGRYLEEHPHEGNALVRLFGTSNSYQKHFKNVLERRISQINGIDSQLKRYLERGIEDLPDHPAVWLENIRGVVNQAFDLIWKAELGEKSVPTKWIVTWKYNGIRGIDDWEIKFPQGGQCVKLLSLMTGMEKSDPYAKYVTKGTCVLMNAAHGFGNFGAHQEGSPVDTGTAYVALHLCIELAAAITRELPHGNRPAETLVQD